MNEYYESYKAFAEEIDLACDCIRLHKCINLSEEITTTRDTLENLNINEAVWGDSVADSFLAVKDIFVTNLNNIIDSIDSSFSTSESLYLELQRQLMNLETFNNDYQKRYGEKPDESDYHHTELVKGFAYFFGVRKYEDVFDKKKYEAALEKWEGDVERYSGLCEDLIEAIETNKKKLTEINEATISQETVSMISTSLSDFSDILSENENVRYKNLFITDGSPANNAAVIWNFFKYKGLNDAQIAGIISNIARESWWTFSPGEQERGNGVGYGLIQWSYGRRTDLERAAREAGVPVDDMQFQLEFLWDEAFVPRSEARFKHPNGSDYYTRLQQNGFFSTSNPYTASKVFERKVEVSGDKDKEKMRYNRAVRWFEQLGGRDVVTVTDVLSANDNANLY